MTHLGNPERHFRSVHVGGTNGKGSVAVLVAEALHRLGQRVALYTSPHLVDVRERMVVDGRAITKAAFTAWTNELRPVVLEAGASFFEATTAIAFADFAARGAEIAVVEVGLGGRLDCTNVLDPVASVVTHVALEHMDYLGPSPEHIAEEKAGIAKAERPFVIGEREPKLVDVLERVAREAGATVVRVPRERMYDGPLGLQGPHQRRNAAVAETVLEVLPTELRPGDGIRRRAFAGARLPGRLDYRGRWLFDVAHNPSAMQALAHALAAAPPPRPVHALVAILGDKDWRTMLSTLRPVVDTLCVTVAPSAPKERRWDLGAVADGVGDLVVEADFDRALADVQQHPGTILVTGSFHTVGDAMARLPGFAPLP